MTAKIVTLDIETLPALTEQYSLKNPYTSPSMVIKPVRVLCFVAKVYGRKAVRFHAAWDDDDQEAYRAMAQAAWEILDYADVVVGWNSTSFDLKHLNSMFVRLEMGPPSPCRSLDLYKVALKNFNEMSYKLDYFSQLMLGDHKLKTDHLQRQIRWGSDEEKLKAQRMMRRYNVKDVVLTERLFERFLPWTGINFALYSEENSVGRVCPFCESEDIQKRGKAYTTTYAYERVFCNKCKGWSKGKKMVYTTELRPV